MYFFSMQPVKFSPLRVSSEGYNLSPSSLQLLLPLVLRKKMVMCQTKEMETHRGRRRLWFLLASHFTADAKKISNIYRFKVKIILRCGHNIF